MLFVFPQWDTDLFKALNAMHTDWLDPVMVFLSSSLSWVILFFAVAFFMLRRSFLDGLREVGLIVLIVAVNNIFNALVKLLIKRPRPCHEDSLSSTFRILEECGNHYSFFSAHSSNAFCLAICTALFFKNRYYSFLILIWAALVAYSRIYVGKHYPLDVVFGVLFGIITSFVGNYFLRKYRSDKIKE